MAAPALSQYVAELMSGTSHTLTITVTAGYTLIMGYLYGLNRVPNPPTIGGVGQTEITHATTPGNNSHAWGWYKTGASGGSTPIIFTTNFATSAYVFVFEIEASTLDQFDAVAGSANTTHLASASGIATADNVFIVAAGCQDAEIRSIVGTHSDYTRLDVPTSSPAQAYVGYRRSDTSVSGQGNSSMWTTDNAIAGPTWIASFAGAGAPAGHPTMRRWGGVPFVGGRRSLDSHGGGGGQAWGRSRGGLIVPKRFQEAA